MPYLLLLPACALVGYGLVLLVSDVRGRARQVRATAVCRSCSPGLLPGEVVYALAPLVHEGRALYGELRGRRLGVRVGEPVEVVFDPLWPRRMYPAGRVPALPRLPVVLLYGGAGIALACGALLS
ncbi:hypothetical protein ACFV3R_06880 [Streptomyces sp. NPDC059740]|uniref:hypothetical protein n=1 Tax=Streptomyces sp. NPDC059740 TaxID=3346926 RepID=UPI0036520400